VVELWSWAGVYLRSCGCIPLLSCGGVDVCGIVAVCVFVWICMELYNYVEL